MLAAWLDQANGEIDMSLHVRDDLDQVLATLMDNVTFADDVVGGIFEQINSGAIVRVDIGTTGFIPIDECRDPGVALIAEVHEYLDFYLGIGAGHNRNITREVGVRVIAFIENAGSILAWAGRNDLEAGVIATTLGKGRLRARVAATERCRDDPEDAANQKTP